MCLKKNMLLASLVSTIFIVPLQAQDVGMEKTIAPRQMADALHLVMEADRTVYTKKVVNRLTKKDKVITASEHFKDDKALPLPAQMFRFGAETAAEKIAKKADIDFSYSLQSIWPVNKQNAPKTDAEKEGLQFVADNPGKNFYTMEELAGKKYFTAVYADVAVAPVCVSCHNDHKDSPRTDFKIGDTMGGVVIRIAQ
ncbi:MAG: Adenylate cyclase (EC [uncultured Thiotrichaceae bacterium]|uniref:Adenylate cyclase (EC) n=1 Tax=uncultured Thiotrichaceae bacterium TaxID=298394 RepID=A0A6S6RY59_9GAMM|nr:MAG: Adenylate cyclase (EC [uncultured Thiotrichaceae bacterium]